LDDLPSHFCVHFVLFCRRRKGGRLVVVTTVNHALPLPLEGEKKRVMMMDEEVGVFPPFFFISINNFFAVFVFVSRFSSFFSVDFLHLASM